MVKLKGLPSLLLIVATVWIVMRAVHFLLPVLQPEVLPGPFVLERLSEVEAITGFSARLPLYHPEELGTEPGLIRAAREPQPEATIVWRDERFLELLERPAEAPAFEVPDDAELLEDRQLHLWRRGAVVYAAGTVRGINFRLRTDLSREDVLRIVSTLVPLTEVR